MSETDDLREALKRVAVVLKSTGLPFALAGGYAAWALGGPEPSHDVDFLISPEDVDQAKKALADEGLEVRQPPEDWLFKVSCDGVTVDVLHRGSGRALPDTLSAAQTLEVLSVEMPVLAATDVLVHKLLALDEHYCDLSSILSVARALREQVAWSTVRESTAGWPFAEAVLFLLERLDVIAAA
jgi:hypothetical protein